MTNQVIPVEAVEAAARRIFACAEYGHRSREWDALERRNAINQARAALEAAAPYMLAGVLDLHQEDLFRGHLSNGCKTCSGGEWPCATYTAAML